MDSFDIRESKSADLAEIDRLYPDAFPDEELRPVVNSLLRDGPDVLSLVAIAGTKLLGHVLFTRCSISDGTKAVALLGPLAVGTARQKQGIGTALVREGLNRLRSREFDQIFVLGDPAYYGRLGFVPERSVAPPYPLPEEWRDAWQSINLRSNAPEHQGTLSVPPEWNDPTLWAP